MLTSTVVPLTRSRTKMSVAPLVSPGMRLPAALSNKTYRPLVEMLAGNESPSPPPVPFVLTLTSVIAPLERSRRKTFIRGGEDGVSGALLASSAVRLLAVLEKRTNRPSGLTMGTAESPLPPAGAAAGSLTEPSCKTPTPAWENKIDRSPSRTARQNVIHLFCMQQVIREHSNEFALASSLLRARFCMRGASQF